MTRLAAAGAIILALVAGGVSLDTADARTCAAEARAGDTSRLCERLERLRPALWRWYRYSGADCIRTHEGRWDDPNAPYWGGFQANRDFMRGYAPGAYRRWGTADRWQPTAQVYMAWRGWKARGFQPWPSTRRICGV